MRRTWSRVGERGTTPATRRSPLGPYLRENVNKCHVDVNCSRDNLPLVVSADSGVHGPLGLLLLLLHHGGQTA